MRADDIMSVDVVTVAPDTDISEIARTLIEYNVSAVPVVDSDGNVIGVVSEGDLMRREESGTERHPSWWLTFLADSDERARDYVKSHGHVAKDVMTRKVITVTEDTQIEDIAEILEKNRIKRVPVVRDHKLVGIVSRANLLHGLIARRTRKAADGDDRAIRKTILAALGETGVRTELIDVVVNKGVVSLWGAVESDAQADAIRVAAESADGVQRIDNQVTVMPRLVRASYNT